MSVFLTLNGRFNNAGQSRTWIAQLECDESGAIHLNCAEANVAIAYERGAYALSKRIPGLPITFLFEDGSVFLPEPSSQADVLEWSRQYRKGKSIEWFEHSRKALFFSALAIPLIVMAFYFYGPTTIANSTVYFIPYSVEKQVGEQTLYLLEKAELSDSALPLETQNNIRAAWQHNLAELALPDRGSYQLLFRHSDVFKNNAFALSNRTIVITDSLIESMGENSQAIQAVLLHETGHLIYRHNIKILVESFYTTLLTAFLLGDSGAINETLLSLGTGVINSSFSRDMEREADGFAIQGLKQLTGSADGFADAMNALGEAHSRHREEGWLEYLFSSHPPIQERIEAAQ